VERPPPGGPSRAALPGRRERLEDVKDAFFERSGKITLVFRERE
jgi:hypothetical protein